MRNINEFARASKILAGIRESERRTREYSRSQDWDRSSFRIAGRQKARRELLDSLAPDRRCPTCLEVRPNPRSWVVTRDGKFAVCRSCHQRVGGRLSDEVVVRRRTICELDGPALRRARGTSLREFARRVGLSPGSLSRLETKVTQIDDSLAEKIQACLSDPVSLL